MARSGGSARAVTVTLIGRRESTATLCLMYAGTALAKDADLLRRTG